MGVSMARLYFQVFLACGAGFLVLVFLALAKANGASFMSQGFACEMWMLGAAMCSYTFTLILMSNAADEPLGLADVKASLVGHYLLFNVYIFVLTGASHYTGLIGI